MEKEIGEEVHWNIAKEYKSDKSAAVADQLSIIKDLEFVIGACNLILQVDSDSTNSRGAITNPSDNDIQMVSLWNSALVAYGRCFNSGVRKNLKIEIFDHLGEKKDDAINAHMYFIDLRDKYVAHSVSRFEDIRFVLLVGDGDNSPKGVVGGGPFLMKPAFENLDNVKSLRNLANFSKGQIELTFEQEVKAVIEETKKLDEDQLLSLKNMDVPIPVQPHEAGKRRP